MSTNPVIHNEAAHQFEISADGATAILTYRLKPKSILFLHTEVPEQFRGRGIAGQLASAGLDFARQRSLAVVPLCPFVAGYIKKHQEYLDIVREDYREGLLTEKGDPA
jgi:uncharacterized protein